VEGMDAGNTFKYGRGSHLWVVVSDPAADPDHVVIVNMTTDRGIDRSCILNAGDHPFVVRQTCMRYDMARIVKNSELERFASSSTITVHERVSEEVLARIRQGAAASSQIPLGCKQVLIDQRLIEP
jgi:hypothetical protein